MKEKVFWDKVFKVSGIDYEKLYVDIYGETITDARNNMDEREEDVNFKFFQQCWNSNQLSQHVIDYYIEKKHMFFTFYATYIAYAERVILSELETKMVITDKFRESIYTNLYRRLVSQSIQIIIQELEIAKREGKIPSADSVSEYLYYENNILTDQKYHFYLAKKYPVMFKEHKETTILFCNYVIEVMQNILSNRIEVSRNLGFNQDIEYIEAFNVSQGDVHQGGKSVSEIILDSGKKIIYKPRDLKIDDGFQSLIDWMNYKIQNPDYQSLKTTRQYVGNGFGIVEYIEHKYCGEEEIKNYYFKLGELLAVLYVLDASDIHRENIIACAGEPVIIDCETLFSPYNMLADSVNNAADIEIYRMTSTVQRIGILPFFISGKHNEAGYGGVDYSQGQKSPFKTAKIINVNRSDVKVVYTYELLQEEKNSPMPIDKKLDQKLMANQIIKGFDLVVRWISDNRFYVIEKVNNLFSQVNIRILLKSTMIYDSTLEISYHPEIMMDYLDRKIILLRNLVQSNTKKDIDKCECFDLLCGDIPMFHTKYEDTFLNWRSKTINNFFDSSAKQRFEVKIKELSERIISLQEYIIYESLLGNEAEYKVDETGLQRQYLKTMELNETSNHMKAWLVEMAQYLIDKSISFGDGYRVWIERGFDERYNKFMPISQIDYELYLGEMGMVVLFVDLYKVTKEQNYLNIAKQIVKYPMKEIDYLEDSDRYNIGAFSGFSGRMYAISKLYQESRDEEYLQYINKYASLLESSISNDRNLDIVGGTAGLLMVLLSMKENKIPFVYEKNIETSIQKCVSHIVEQSTCTVNGISWLQCIEDKPKMYTGFSHGSMGILVSLARYKSIYKTKKIDHILYGGIQWMNSMYCDSLKNWYKDSSKEDVSYGWCHGSSGILLGYTLIQKYCPEFKEVRTYAEYAKNATLSCGLGKNSTLCHGDLGNLEILNLYGDVFQDGECLELYKKGVLWEFENIILKRWKGKSFRGRELVGMMVGLAGYGYSIAKYMTEGHVPSVLYLE